MAKPQFGTSATQAACLFDVLGPEKAKQYYRDLARNEIRIVAGNKQVAEGVSAGQFAVGVTDTDDAIIEVKAGKPVALIFPDREAPAGDRMGTLFIPNTLAIIRGGPNPAGARRLVDYLLSTTVEEELSGSASCQIPLNPLATPRLPPQILTPKTAKPMAVNWDHAADLWDDVQTFLRNEFTVR